MARPSRYPIYVTLYLRKVGFVRTVNMSLVEAPRWQQYVASVYFVTLTLTTVGYGDITPVTPAEQIVTICIMLIGIVFFGFAISSSQ